jgi:hypothetical protein
VNSGGIGSPQAQAPSRSGSSPVDELDVDALTVPAVTLSVDVASPLDVPDPPPVGSVACSPGDVTSDGPHAASPTAPRIARRTISTSHPRPIAG